MIPALDVIPVEEHYIRASIDVVIEGDVKTVAKGTIFRKVSHSVVSMRRVTITWGSLQG